MRLIAPISPNSKVSKAFVMGTVLATDKHTY